MTKKIHFLAENTSLSRDDIFFFTAQILLIFTGLNQHMLAINFSKFHPNPTTSVRVTLVFQLKEHLYTFELPPKRDMSLIELIFTGQYHNTLAIHSTKFDQNPMTFTEVISRFQLKEHLYTFELPPKRNMSPIELIFTGQHRGASAMSPTKSHPNPTTPTEVINRFQLKEHLYTFELPPKRDPPPI